MSYDTPVNGNKGNTLNFQYLIIAGVPKAATTSFFKYISEHPQVCPANRKETYFFARDFDYKHICQYEETREGFEQYFLHCTKSNLLRVEATPYTLYASDAARKINLMLPNSAVLFILRDPISRLFSDYQFHFQREHPSAAKPFEAFVNRQLEIKGGRVPNLVELGRYMYYLPNFLEVFGRERVFILFFEEFTNQQEAEMGKICTSMGIDPRFYSNYLFEDYNRTVHVKYRTLSRTYQRLEPVVAKLRAHLLRYSTLNTAFEAVLKHGKSLYSSVNDNKNHKPEVIPEELYNQLADYYRPFNQALEKEVCRPLPWPSFKTVEAKS